MKIQLPILNFPKQDEIFECPTRIVVVKKGRRFGFTKGAVNKTVKVALNGTRKKGLWVDTVNTNIEKYVERYFVPILRKLPQGMWTWQKQQKLLKIGGFYMDFRSAETPENIEGFGYDFMILNEAGIILKDKYLWENTIRPMMWDTDCQAFIGGTPKGGGAVFEELYNRGIDPLQPGFKSFHVISFDNPYLPTGLIEEDMKTMPQRVIDQEIYGKFLEDTGIVFRGIDRVAILKEGKEPKVDHMYVIGCDLAKLVDYTVLVVYDRTNNEQVFQMRFKHLEWPFIRSKIRAVSEKYNKALVMLDSSGVGEPIYDDLSRSGVPIEPIHFTNEIKKGIIEKLANWIELRNLKMLDLKETKDELTQFTYDISEKTDRVFYGAPVGFHDDIVIAHALACWSLQPVAIKVLPKEMPEVAIDIAKKTAEYNNNEEGEFGEYEEEDTGFGPTF